MDKMTTKRLLLTLALIVVAVGPLWAQSGVFDRAGSIAGHGTYSSVPGESVDLFTGNLMLAFRDIFLPGPEGLELEIWRVYNSKVLGDGSPGQGGVQAYPKSMLGIGWSMHMGIITWVAWYLRSSGKSEAFVEKAEKALTAYLDSLFGPLNFQFDYFMNSESPVPAYDY
jgi:hypothetical protein